MSSVTLLTRPRDACAGIWRFQYKIMALLLSLFGFPTSQVLKELHCSRDLQMFDRGDKTNDVDPTITGPDRRLTAKPT